MAVVLVVCKVDVDVPVVTSIVSVSVSVIICVVVDENKVLVAVELVLNDVPDVILSAVSSLSVEKLAVEVIDAVPV